MVRYVEEVKGPEKNLKLTWSYVELCLIFIIYKTETQGREHQLINRASFDTAKDKSKTNFQIGQPQQDDPRVPLRPIDRPLFEIKVKGQVNVLAIVCFPRGLWS